MYQVILIDRSFTFKTLKELKNFVSTLETKNFLIKVNGVIKS
jgi:hypothetical protein